ncbi:MAG: flippase [Parcubacteria group bacterium]|nr:flippase [Parcubacteria group bacterium]
MSTPNRIIRNTAFLSAGYVGQKLLSFVYFTLIARMVGVLDTGSYVFALSYSTIWSVFVDFGLSNLLQREIAQKPAETARLVRATLGIKMLYGAASVALGLVVIFMLGEPKQTLSMVAIAMAVMLFDSFSLTVWAAFRGHHQLRYEAIAIVLSQSIVLAVGVAGLWMGARLEMLIVALLCGSVFTAIMAALLCRRDLGFWPLPRFGGFDYRQWLVLSVPFGLAGAFARVFASIDTVMLSQMKGNAAVGFYAVPNKVVFAAQFIPAAFSAAIYPAMSHYYLQDRAKMKAVFQQALLFLFLLAMPMSVGIFTLSPILIRELYTGAYDPSILSMQVMAWAVIFGFLEFPVGALLAAAGEQKKNSITRGVVMVFNIVLNIILIPRYSFLGTSIAALASYIVLAGMGFYWARSYFSGAWDLFAAAAKIIFAGAAMGLLVTELRPYLNFVLVIILAALAYGVLAFALRIVTLSQLAQLFRRFKNGEGSTKPV